MCSVHQRTTFLKTVVLTAGMGNSKPGSLQSSPMSWYIWSNVFDWRMASRGTCTMSPSLVLHATRAWASVFILTRIESSEMGAQRSEN